MRLLPDQENRRASRSDIRHVFRIILDRKPDRATMKHWVEEVRRRGLTPHQLGMMCLNSAEFSAKKPELVTKVLELIDRGSFVKEKEALVASLNTPVEALASLGREAWFHTFQLSDGTVVEGAKSLDLLKAEYKAVFGRLQIQGRSVLDIGAWNGAFSFEAKRLGAARVLAVDMYTWTNPQFRGLERFLYVRKDQALDIEYRLLDIAETCKRTVGKFDIVLFLGVFYHLQDPLSAIMSVAEVTGSWLVLETHLDLDYLTYPGMRHYPGRELANDPTNWWGPNQKCVEALLLTAGFADVHFLPHPVHSQRGIFHARK
jgi:tRNA (mo5U34)-methyltransferase